MPLFSKYNNNTLAGCAISVITPIHLILSGLYFCILLFKYPHKKCRGVKSGNLCGNSFDPLRTIHLSVGSLKDCIVYVCKSCSNNLLATLNFSR